MARSDINHITPSLLYIAGILIRFVTNLQYEEQTRNRDDELWVQTLSE